MIAAALLLLGQVIVPSGEAMSSEQRVEVLARNVTARSFTMIDLFENADLRAEMKRVGLAEGCPVADRASREAVRNAHDQIIPHAREAVRSVIPADRLDAMRPVSFMMGTGSLYEGRVRARLAELADKTLGGVRKRAETAFTTQSANLPDWTPSPDDEPLLHPVAVNALGADPAKTFDSAPLLSLACMMRSPPKAGNLTISSGGETWRASDHYDEPDQSPKNKGS